MTLAFVSAHTAGRRTSLDRGAKHADISGGLARRDAPGRRADVAAVEIRGKVRERTDRRFASVDLDVVVGYLNPVLRGWGNYFRHGNSNRKFHAVDSYVHQRVARLASIKHGLRGTNWDGRFNYRWLQTLGVHQLTGTIGPRNAHA